MGTKNSPGKYDCYEKAGDDEPIFVLRAKDPLAPILVTSWASMTGISPRTKAKVMEAHACAAAMRDWKRKNPKG